MVSISPSASLLGSLPEQVAPRHTDPAAADQKSLDYRRFIHQWTFCHIADAALRGMPFAPNRIELPMPALRSGQATYELEATESSRSLPNIPTVLEPGNSDAGS